LLTKNEYVLYHINVMLSKLQIRLVKRLQDGEQIILGVKRFTGKVTYAVSST